MNVSIPPLLRRVLVVTAFLTGCDEGNNIQDELTDDLEEAAAWEGLEESDMNQLEAQDGEDIHPDAMDDITAAPDSLLASAPTCLDVVVNTTDGFVNLRRVRVKNNCGSKLRFRFIWRWAPDSACLELAPGGYATSERKNIPRPYITEFRKC